MQRPRLLIVDDDRLNLGRLDCALSGHGFAVLTACDVTQALAHLEREVPDLILLQPSLASPLGLALLQQVTADPALQTVPIVALGDASGEGAAHPGVYRTTLRALVDSTRDTKELSFMLASYIGARRPPVEPS